MLVLCLDECPGLVMPDESYCPMSSSSDYGDGGVPHNGLTPGGALPLHLLTATAARDLRMWAPREETAFM